MNRWLHNLLPALSSRDYRRFAIGQIVSLNGTWMSHIAESWLVYELTRSTMAVGVVRFLHTIPVTFLSFYGGSLADRHNKRRILLITQSVSLSLALVMFAMTVGGAPAVWGIGLIAMCLGTAHAFDIPARQSFLVEMVGKDALMNAITINSTVFNSARMCGPALAGLVVEKWGAPYCFLINALSFGAALYAYSTIRTNASPNHTEKTRSRPRFETWKLVLARPPLRRTIALVAVASFFATPYMALAPAFVDQQLQGSGGAFARLMAANGVGAFAGALTLIVSGGRFSKAALLGGGSLGLAVALLIFSTTAALFTASLAIAAGGWFMILFFSSANTLTQLSTPDGMRGRVMGLYSFCFIGISPFGALTMSGLASALSVSTALTIGAGALMVAALWASFGFLQDHRRNQEITP